MANIAEIIRDFIELGHDYFALHQKYAQELKDNEHLKDVPNSVAHEAQNKLTTLNSMFKNGDLPVKPVIEKIKEDRKEVDNILTEDVSLKEKLEDLRKLKAAEEKPEETKTGMFDLNDPSKTISIKDDTKVE